MTTCHASTTPFPRLSYGLALVLGGLLVFCALQGKAQQQDTVYQLDPIQVTGQNDVPAVQSIAPVQSMDAKSLEAMPAVQVSDEQTYISDKFNSLYRTLTVKCI